MRRIFKLFALALALLAGTGCGIDKTPTPDGFSGPSEFGIALTMAASPELLPRDGASQSVIAITLRDTSGNPIGNRAVRVAASAGRLAATEVTTGSNGVATVLFTAPGVNEDVQLVTIQAAPSGTDWAVSVPRSVEVRIVGAAMPVPRFNVTPAADLARFQLALFDATATTASAGGPRCGTDCTFAWDFGGEATATGESVSYRFREERTYLVTLTVTTRSGGTSASTSKTVTVGAGTLPTAALRISPTSPCINQTVFLNASESKAANGAEIREYQWDLGNGTRFTAESATSDVSFPVTGSYTVLLTVVDSNGLRGSTTGTVTVRGPTTAPNGTVTPCQ